MALVLLVPALQLKMLGANRKESLGWHSQWGQRGCSMVLRQWVGRERGPPASSQQGSFLAVPSPSLALESHKAEDWRWC